MIIYIPTIMIFKDYNHVVFYSFHNFNIFMKSEKKVQKVLKNQKKSKNK
jgi:hypothetical protein